MASPSVSRWSSVRLPIATTFPQAPLRSRTVGFPQPGSDLGFPSWAFPDSRRSSSTDIHTPRPRWFTYELVPRFEGSLFPTQCPSATLGPPSAQSPFASQRCYRREEGMCCLLEGRYPFVVARTGSCARPVALHPASASPRSVGLCSLLPAAAGHRPFPTLSLPILRHVSGPLLRLLPRCTRPLLPTGHWPSPR